MRWSNFWRALLRVLFILYCIEAGVLLALSPWREIWSRLIVELPWDVVRSTLMTPLGRSAITGFGLVHLVWGFHDLNQLLGRGRVAAQRSSPGERSADADFRPRSRPSVRP